MANDSVPTRLFYNLWQSRMHKIHLSETIGKTCCASYHGWLLFVAPEGTELFLLNPLTRALVELPSFTPPVKHMLNLINPYLFYFLFKTEMRNYVISKMTYNSVLLEISPNLLLSDRGPLLDRVGRCSVQEWNFLFPWWKIDCPFGPKPTQAVEHMSFQTRVNKCCQVIYFWKGNLGFLLLLLLSITLNWMLKQKTFGMLLSKQLSCTSSKGCRWRSSGLLTQAKPQFF